MAPVSSSQVVIENYSKNLWGRSIKTLYNVTKSDALENKYINLLKEYLMHCDMVKYAKLEPDKAECSKLIETTRRFVEETKLVEVFNGYQDLQEARA